jgi:hypothetical protein
MKPIRTTGAALGAMLLLAASTVGAPAPIDRGVRLEWQFVTDKPFYQKTVTQTSQKMKVAGNEITQTQTQVFLVRWAPVKQLPDRSWVINQKIEAVRVDIDIGGSKISIDSARPDVNNPLSEFFDALVGAELTLTISPRKKVTKVEGRDALLAKLAKANPALKPMLEAVLSESGLKEMAEPLFAPLPGKSVQKGERWAEESKVDMGPLGTYAVTSRYVFEGPDTKDRKLVRVGVNKKLTYTAPRPGAGGGLPFKVKSSDLKSSEATGTIFVSPSKGRIERSEVATRLRGRMTIEIGGMDTEIEIDQTQTVTVTTSDALPGANKPRR